MKQAYLLLGEIVRPQGIRGEVKVKHYTDDPYRFEDLETVYLKRGNEYQPVGVVDARVQKDDVYLALEGVEDRNEAEKLRGVELWVDRENAVELDEDQVFIADILGAKAYDTKGNEIGTLKDVLTPGGVDVFVFKTKKGTLMMPALKTVILEMDADEGKIILDGIKSEHKTALWLEEVPHVCTISKEKDHICQEIIKFLKEAEKLSKKG